ncbi:metal-dependent hydrolase [Ahrensia sp. R2A130]|uniref:metal-dependent hydrolase n=1 Tax=Ahrensia sp. R2A130 TaxID=744979 RepID=UPI0001E0D0A1|nr:metal-dependent hydrolase [Ahrensia sp. R2A130]EFL90288.1 metal-dependent hydrolase [Ahrensia sp. R2A130]
MKLTFLGHSAFRIDAGAAHILIDPFFSGNPSFDEAGRAEAIEGITHIALTHGHGDHVGDTVAIAAETGATVIGNFDLTSWLAAKGVANTDGGNTGGTLHHEGFSVTFTQAFHSSTHVDENGVSHDLGSANGLVFHFADGPSVYHMGDTDIFGDMALIQELHQPQIGLVPIGDRFTMGGAVAALACQRYFKFETIVPCHYGSFPIIDQSADSFVAAMNSSDTVKVVEPGGSLEL